MSKMHEEAWYLQKQIVQNYESYYQTKYKRADMLEKRLLKKLLEQIGDTQTLLEVGCGTGHFTRWMETLRLECYGLDLSSVMLREAKKLWPKGLLLQGESSYLPFKARSFDVVVFIACLEYMPNIVAVFGEAARVTRKGIIIGLMNKWSLPTIRRIIQVKMGKNPYYKKAKFYSISEIKRILKDSLGEKYAIVYWATTVLAKALGDKDSTVFPFGSFLGVAVKLGDVHDRCV
jgi:ubiquinone/menaquinone biosynthesis C-methylase UbiE